MTYREPAQRTTRRIPSILFAGLLVVVAAIAASLGYPLLSSASPSPPASSSRPVSSVPAASRLPILRSEPPAGLADLGETDGVVSEGTTVFDDEVPGVANLDAALLRALRRAATDATGDGVEIFVTSGWRSRTYQERLFRQAVSEYGSTKRAARWVATPGTSAHESGDAVDIGHADATAWLSEHGAKYGLCQIYRNEPWHYELRPKATDHGCPQMYADPRHDPRMEHAS